MAATGADDKLRPAAVPEAGQQFCGLRNCLDERARLKLHRRLYFVFQGAGGLVEQGIFCFFGGFGTV